MHDNDYLAEEKKKKKPDCSAVMFLKNVAQGDWYPSLMMNVTVMN